MADPITIATTLISVASFIQDLIEVGQSIKRSIEKVGENRRRIRDLTNDVLRALADLANLTRMHEDVTFQAPALLDALGNLMAEMLYVLSVCQAISPLRRPGLRGFGSQINAWMKRDDLERKIGRLREHVNQCCLQFTAFAAARIEYTTLRTEQNLVLRHVENQGRLQRLEGLMARVLLETQFGQEIMNQSITIMSTDPSHNTLESKFLSVQTMRLVDSVQQMLTSGKLVLRAPLWNPSQPLRLVLPQSTPTLHVLHAVLGAVITIDKSRTTCIPLDSIKDTIFDLGVQLAVAGMTSEGIAWENLKIRVFRYLARGDYFDVALWGIAHALRELSLGYQRQLQVEAALQASQKSVDLWHHLSDSLPEVDNRISLAVSLATHSKNLLETSQELAALSTVQEAVALSRPMVQQLIQSSLASSSSSLTEDDAYKAVMCCQTLFALATAFSSLDRHLEAYEAFQEAFRTSLELPVSTLLLCGTEIDSFVDQICHLAEEDNFSLVMLADCVNLFHSLARRHPKEASTEFLWFLHAYLYYSQRDNSSGSPPSLEDLRVFLEINSDPFPPDVTAFGDFKAEIDKFDRNGDIIEDTIRAFYTQPLQSSGALLRSVFIANLERAAVALREVVLNSCSDLLSFPGNSHTLFWVEANIIDMLPFMSHPHRLQLLEIMADIIEHFRAITTSTTSAQMEPNSFIVVNSMRLSVWGFWLVGSLTEALSAVQESIEYLQLCPSTNDVDDSLRWTRLCRLFVLCDMGRIADAVEAVQETNTISLFALGDWETDATVPLLFLIQTRILRRTKRHQEALRKLRKATKQYRTSGRQSLGFNLHFSFLLAELATAWGEAGFKEKALEVAEEVVAGCREVDTKDVDGQKCTLVHSLTTLSNCLAAVGRDAEALAIIEEAMSMYTQHAACMWENFVYTIRKQELGANAFHALSLRLTTTGEFKQALINAEKGTDLYRELVALSPRQLPALATNLQNLASTLWNVDRREESIGACKEAISIIQRVSEKETYFFPVLLDYWEQLSGYLSAMDDVDGASTANAECTDVQRKINLLPLSPNLPLFDADKFGDLKDEEDLWDVFAESGSEVPNLPPAGRTISSEEVSPPAKSSSSRLILATGSEETNPNPPRSSDSAARPRCQKSPLLSNGITEINQSKNGLKTIEVKLSLSATPMDILWWLLLGILGAVFLWNQIEINQ